MNNKRKKKENEAGYLTIYKKSVILGQTAQV
jgi:hypothetical protein